jgi:SAM-dependent methyltransferase
MTDANDRAREQREYWDGAAGQRWANAQERLDRNLGPIHAELLEFAAPSPADRVLDVGCGCGTTTLQLRAQTASARGLDISTPMLAVARSRAVGTDVVFDEADAQTAVFAAAYDLVFSRFGVMFFGDPVAAFANLRTALAPNGRIVFACWRALAENTWAAAPLAAVRDLLPPSPPPDPTAPGPFAFADRARLADILSKAGLRATIEPRDTRMELGASAAEAADEALTIGPLARAAADLPPATIAQVRERVIAAFEAHVTSRGVTPRAAIWLVRATI